MSSTWGRWLGAGIGAVLAAGGLSVQPAAAGAPVGESGDPVDGGVVRGSVDQAHSPRLPIELTSGNVRKGNKNGRLEGIDVASHQHPGGAGINWRLVARGYRFVGVKATEGRYYANPHRLRDQNGARGAGMYAFAYHFAVPNDSGGAAQAKYFLDHAGYRADGKTLNPVLDIEWNPYASSDHTNACYGFTRKRMIWWIRGFVREVERRTGRTATIYTAAGWWNECTGGTSAFAGSPLWVAAISDRPTLPTGWSRWQIWQHGQRTVRGITAVTDVNWLNGGEHELAALAKG
jgi:lysozyme